MPVSSRRCGMITKREAERLCKSFLAETSPPKLPENFSFDVYHQCSWGSRGSFIPSRYNSSRAKCIKCLYCNLFFSPNKFIFHSHRLPDSKYVQPDAANFNSWRRHIKLNGNSADEVMYAWEDVKAMFNGGSRKRNMIKCINSFSKNESKGPDSEYSKRQKRDSPSPEVSHPVPPSNFPESRPAASPTVPASSYYPIVPFPNKAYPLAANLNAAPALPQTYTKLFPGGPQPDFRQNFAEFMWPGKRPSLELPYNGLLWHRPMMDTPVSRMAHELCYHKNDKNASCISKEMPAKEDVHAGSKVACPESASAMTKEVGFHRHFSAFKPVNKYSSSAGHMIHEIVASSVVATPSPESDNNEVIEEDNVDVDVIGTEDEDNNCTLLESSGSGNSTAQSRDEVKHISCVAKDLNQIPDRNSISEKTNLEVRELKWMEEDGEHGG